MYNSSGVASIFQGGEGEIIRGSGEMVQILTSATGWFFKILFKYSINFIGFSTIPLAFILLVFPCKILHKNKIFAFYKILIK